MWHIFFFCYRENFCNLTCELDFRVMSEEKGKEGEKGEERCGEVTLLSSAPI